MLKIIDSPKERVLRSVGDPPHGVVGYMGDGERFGVVVSARFDPDHDVNMITAASDDRFQNVPLDTAEAVAALDDPVAAVRLLHLAQTATMAVCQMGVVELDPTAIEPAKLALDSFSELAGEIAERFGDG